MFSLSQRLYRFVYDNIVRFSTTKKRHQQLLGSFYMQVAVLKLV